MDIVDKALRNWKLHLLVLVFTVLAETVGVRTFKLGPGMLVLIPLLYSFVLGALCGLPALRVAILCISNLIWRIFYEME